MFSRRNIKILWLKSLSFHPSVSSSILPCSLFIYTPLPSLSLSLLKCQLSPCMCLYECTPVSQSITLCHSPGEAHIMRCQRKNSKMTFCCCYFSSLCELSELWTEWRHTSTHQNCISFEEVGINVGRRQETWHWSNVNQSQASVKWNGTSRSHCVIYCRVANFSSGPCIFFRDTCDTSLWFSTGNFNEFYYIMWLLRKVII